MPFSKKIEYLKAAVALHFGYYIFAGRIRPLTDTVYGGWNHRPCLVSGRTSFLALDDTEPSGREEKGNVFFSISGCTTLLTETRWNAKGISHILNDAPHFGLIGR
jgi:hypothetical protein